MKKLILVLGIITFLISMKSEELTNDQIVNDVEWFIDTVKANSYGGDQFIVYVLYIYKNDSLENGYCCAMSYINNSNTLTKIIKPYYYFEKGSDVIVVALEEGLTKKQIPSLNLIDLDLEKTIKVAQKLFPAAVGVYTGTYQGMVCCYGEDHYRKLYNDRDYFPSDVNAFRISGY